MNSSGLSFEEEQATTDRDRPGEDEVVVDAGFLSAIAIETTD